MVEYNWLVSGNPQGLPMHGFHMVAGPFSTTARPFPMKNSSVASHLNHLNWLGIVINTCFTFYLPPWSCSYIWFLLKYWTMVVNSSTNHFSSFYQAIGITKVQVIIFNKLSSICMIYYLVATNFSTFKLITWIPHCCHSCNAFKPGTLFSSLSWNSSRYKEVSKSLWVYLS